MAVYFPRTANDHLIKTGLSVFNPPMTICAWFKADDVTTRHGIAMLANPSFRNWSYILNIDGTDASPLDPVQAIESRGTGTQKSQKGTVSVSTWHHGAAVFRYTNYRLGYLDGSPATANTSSLTQPQDPTRMFIGQVYSGVSEQYMKGTIAEVAVWSAELSGSIIAEMATGMSAACYPTDLEYYWTLDSDYTEYFGGPSMTVGAGSPSFVTHPTIDYGCGGGFGPEIQVI